MMRYVEALGNHLHYKILAGLVASVYSDELVILLLIFLMLEIIDIFSAWVVASRKCWSNIYPQSKVGFWKLVKFIPTARRWRVIQSEKLRDGFDKMVLYFILILLAGLIDGALMVAHTPFKGVFLSTITTVICLTESISILENLNDAGVPLVSQIKEKLLGKFDKQKEGGI